MSSSAAIYIVTPVAFDSGADQPPGSERREAIAPAVGIASAIWGGLFEVEPGAWTGIHHHLSWRAGDDHYCCPASAIFVGAQEVNSRRTRRPATSFMFLVACSIWKSIPRNANRFDGLSCAAQRRHCRELSQRRLAVSPMSSYGKQDNDGP